MKRNLTLTLGIRYELEGPLTERYNRSVRDFAFNASLPIEKDAQALWKELELYTTDLTNEEKEKYYLLFEFPYPSGDYT